MSSRLQRKAQKMALEFKTNIGLVVELLELLPQNEVAQVLKMKPHDLRQTARVNLLEHTRTEIIGILKEENIQAAPLKAVPEGINIFKGAGKIGSSLSYLKGLVMPQGLGSMLTVEVLDPQPGETILDMSAAPGGKSCFIGERLRGEGLLISNDISTRRLRALIFNLSRHHIENSLVLNQDGRKLQDILPDRILLDAPCTGGGLIVSKPHIRSSKSLSDSIQLQRLQMALLNRALSILPSGGVCVYSTCAFSPLENEMVVKQFAPKVEFMPVSIQGEKVEDQGSHVATRLFPHKHRCDGFFITKMVKL